VLAQPWLCGTIPLIAASLAAGQVDTHSHEPDAFLNQQRMIEERLRSEFKEEVGARQRTLFDWGGWYNLHLFLFDDGVESSRTFRRHDLRIWGRVVFNRGAHELYTRTRYSLLDFNTGHSYDGDDDDLEGPNLERGYYRFDLARALDAYAGRSVDYNLVATVGRDLVQFGGGLTLATPLDHLSLNVTYRSLELTGIAGRTVSSVQDFDLSRTAKRTRRSFVGAQLTYLDFERHEPFAYALWQRDRNREAIQHPLQAFDYDSFYVGLGSSGELTKGLRYLVEGVYEAGHSFSEGRFLRDNRIEAWSLLAELEYLFPGPHKARASIEYLLGSGDAQRIASPTNTLGVHSGGHKDSSFIGFGYHDTGLSFAPRYSNLHMWRAGGSFYPSPTSRRFRRLELGTDWYLYYKHHRAAAVSDPTVDVASGYLGWEMDYFANWRVGSDLSITARCGLFFPGKAFGDRGTRTLFLVGLTWSF
jgi:hypothetical protein